MPHSESHQVLQYLTSSSSHPEENHPACFESTLHLPSPGKPPGSPGSEEEPLALVTFILPGKGRFFPHILQKKFFVQLPTEIQHRFGGTGVPQKTEENSELPHRSDSVKKLKKLLLPSLQGIQDHSSGRNEGTQ